MDKSQRFIDAVKIGIALRRLGERQLGHTAMWASLIDLDDARSVSTRIPRDLSPQLAALQYLEWTLGDCDGVTAEPPSWCIRA